MFEGLNRKFLFSHFCVPQTNLYTERKIVLIVTDELQFRASRSFFVFHASAPFCFRGPVAARGLKPKAAPRPTDLPFSTAHPPPDSERAHLVAAKPCIQRAGDVMFKPRSHSRPEMAENVPFGENKKELNKRPLFTFL